MKVKGWNSFYDGWLANIFGQELDESKDEGWKMGWDTAKVPSRLGDVIKAEIKLGHVMVEAEE